MSRALCLAAFLPVLLLGACTRREAPAGESPPKAPELATVDIAPAPDAAFSTAADRVERRPSADAIAGALPDGFPADIPVHRPASVVDFGARPGGGYAVTFATPSPPATVSAAMATKLRAAGWQAASAGQWTKAGRKLRLVVEATAAGSRYRIEF
ncbi:MAG: hypothetical protein ABI639_07020 [Thermoanaerobaculia bacterium]